MNYERPTKIVKDYPKNCHCLMSANLLTILLSRLDFGQRGSLTGRNLLAMSDGYGYYRKSVLVLMMVIMFNFRIFQNKKKIFFSLFRFRYIGIRFESDNLF